MNGLMQIPGFTEQEYDQVSRRYADRRCCALRGKRLMSNDFILVRPSIQG